MRNQSPRLHIHMIAVVFLVALVSGCAPLAATQAPLPEEPEQSEPELTSPAPTIAALLTPTAVAQIPLLLPPESPAIPEQRLLIVEWPPNIRVGDAEVVRLSLIMDTQGQVTATAHSTGGEVVSTPVEVPNLYDTHHVLADARLDMVGVEFAPQGEISEALLPGKPVEFYWSVRAGDVGSYKGTVWLHLRFIPREGGPASRMVLSGQIIHIESANLFGMSGKAARVAGSVGAVIGSVFGLDSLLSLLLKFIASFRKRLPGK